MSVRPLDPRLLARVRPMRRYVAVTAVLGVTATALVVAQAILVAGVVADVTAGARRPQLRADVGWLAAAVAARSLVAWGQERLGRRAALGVIAELRRAVLAAATRPGRRRRSPDDAALDDAGLATLVTRGLDALDPYLTRYLPQLVLAATLTPAVLVVIAGFDGLSGLIVALTLPLVPLFMALVGLATQSQSRRSLAALQRFGSQLLDLLAGLPTLRAFGRELAQAHRVRELGEAHRRATMRTLRSAFLSALVLETLTTLSIALVAVAIGLRLVHGELDLRTGLTVLMLAPEVYLPLRMVGLHFHASADGLAAADQALAVLDRHRSPAPHRDDQGRSRDRDGLRDGAPHLRLLDVGVDQPGRDVRAPDGVTADLRPGTITAVTGRSGSGKSTLIRVLLGLQPASTGRIEVDGVPLPDPGSAAGARALEAWWPRVTWLPQHPSIVPGTVRDNVLLFHPGPVSDTALEAAAAAAGLDAVLTGLPGGWDARIGHGGLGVSAGQRQRIALARALLAPRPVVLLDEPTAHLDAGTERTVLEAITRLRDGGHLVVLVAHRPGLVAIADDEVPVNARPIETVADPDVLSQTGRGGS